MLVTADDHDIAEIMRATGKAKTVIWRWQERFGQEGVAGLWRDKTRPSRVPPLGPEEAERVVALTLAGPPPTASHWTGAAMAKATAISVSSVLRIGVLIAYGRIWSAGSSCRTIRSSRPSSKRSSASTSIRPTARSSSSTRKAKSRRWTAPSRLPIRNVPAPCRQRRARNWTDDGQGTGGRRDCARRQSLSCGLGARAWRLEVHCLPADADH